MNQNEKVEKIHSEDEDPFEELNWDFTDADFEQIIENETRNDFIQKESTQKEEVPLEKMNQVFHEDEYLHQDSNVHHKSIKDELNDVNISNVTQEGIAPSKNMKVSNEELLQGASLVEDLKIESNTKDVRIQSPLQASEGVKKTLTPIPSIASSRQSSAKSRLYSGTRPSSRGISSRSELAEGLYNASNPSEIDEMHLIHQSIAYRNEGSKMNNIQESSGISDQIDFSHIKRPTTAPRLVTGSRIGTPSSKRREISIHDQGIDSHPSYSDDFTLESLVTTPNTPKANMNNRMTYVKEASLPKLEKITSTKNQRSTRSMEQTSELLESGLSSLHYQTNLADPNDKNEVSIYSTKKIHDSMKKSKTSSKKMKSHSSSSSKMDSSMIQPLMIPEPTLVNSKNELQQNEGFDSTVNQPIRENKTEEKVEGHDSKQSTQRLQIIYPASGSALEQAQTTDFLSSQSLNNNAISENPDSRSNKIHNESQVQRTISPLLSRTISTSNQRKRGNPVPPRTIQTASVQSPQKRIIHQRSVSPARALNEMKSNFRTAEESRVNTLNSPSKSQSSSSLIKDSKLIAHKQKTIERIRKQRQLEKAKLSKEKNLQEVKRNNYAQFLSKLSEKRKRMVKSPMKESVDSHLEAQYQKVKPSRMYWKKYSNLSTIPSFYHSLINVYDQYIALYPSDGIHGIHFLVNKKEWIPISEELIPLKGASIIYNDRIRCLVIYGGMIEANSPYQHQVVARHTRIEEEIHKLKKEKTATEEWIQLEIAHIEENLIQLSQTQGAFEKKSLSRKKKVEELNVLKQKIEELQSSLVEYCQKIDKRIDEKFYSENEKVYQLEEKLKNLHRKHENILANINDLKNTLDRASKKELQQERNKSLERDFEYDSSSSGESFSVSTGRKEDSQILAFQNEIEKLTSTNTYKLYETQVKSIEKKITVCKNSLQSFTDVYESKKAEREEEVKREMSEIQLKIENLQRWLASNSQVNSVKFLEEQILELKQNIKERRAKVSVCKQQLEQLKISLHDNLNLLHDTSVHDIDNNRIWFFHLETQEWKHLKCQPTSSQATIYYTNVYHAPTNCMIIFGGLGANGVSNETNIFSFQRNAWIPIRENSVRESVPSPRYHHTAQAIREGVLMFGGTDGNSCFTDLWVYYILNDEWSHITTTGSTPPPCEHVSSTIFNHDLLIWCQKGIYILNLQTMKWNPPCMDIVSPRIGVSLCTFSGTVILHGGKSGGTGNISSEFYELDYNSLQSSKGNENNPLSQTRVTNQTNRSIQHDRIGHNQSPSKSRPYRVKTNSENNQVVPSSRQEQNPYSMYSSQTTERTRRTLNTGQNHPVR